MNRVRSAFGVMGLVASLLFSVHCHGNDDDGIPFYATLPESRQLVSGNALPSWAFGTFVRSDGTDRIHVNDDGSTLISRFYGDYADESCEQAKVTEGRIVFGKYELAKGTSGKLYFGYDPYWFEYRTGNLCAKSGGSDLEPCDPHQFFIGASPQNWATCVADAATPTMQSDAGTD